MLTPSMDATLELCDGRFQLEDRDGNYFTLLNLTTGERVVRHVSEIKLAERVSFNAKRTPLRFTNATKAQQKAARKLYNHLLEVKTCVHPGLREPRPQYLEAKSLNERIALKVVELQADGVAASRATIFRQLKRLKHEGIAGLIEGNAEKEVAAFGRVDPIIIESLYRVKAARTFRSTIPDLRKIELIVADAEERAGVGNVVIPSRATMYRVLEKAGYSSENAKNTKSNAAKPTRTHRRQRRLIPGAECQIDSTRLDMLIRLADGSTARPIITIIVDVATRSIIGFSLRLEGAKAYDHILLLRQIFVPWANRKRDAASREHVKLDRPHLRLLSLEEKERVEAERPIIYPLLITTDNGGDFIAVDFLSAGAELGIDFNHAPPRKGSGKGIVESTFDAMNEMLICMLPGSVGNSPLNRGDNIEDEELLDLNQL